MSSFAGYFAVGSGLKWVDGSEPDGNIALWSMPGRAIVPSTANHPAVSRTEHMIGFGTMKPSGVIIVALVAAAAVAFLDRNVGLAVLLWAVLTVILAIKGLTVLFPPPGGGSQPPRANGSCAAAPERCPRCGYSLRGNVSGVCPECGTPVTR
jgi:hypothetical protein